MSDPFVQWLQGRLTAHRFPVGPITGAFDPVTEQAVRAFQRRHGLSVTGMADPATVTALRASSSIVSPAVMNEIPDRDNDGDPAIQKIALVDQRWPRERDVPAFFGGVGANLVTIDIPFDMALSFDRATRVRRVTVNRKVAGSVVRVLQRVEQIYSVADRKALGIDVFGGAYNPRRKVGGKSWSMHAYGLALDFDPERNALQTHAYKARLSTAEAAPFWDAWQAEGWLSLGRARDFDWMHVQAARL